MSCLKKKLYANFETQPPAMFLFLGFHKSGLIKSCSCSYDRSVSMQHSTVLRCLVQVLYPPQKFGHPSFWNDWSYDIKICGTDISFSSMTFLLNFIIVCQLIQKLIGGVGGWGDRQTGSWCHKPTFFLPLGRKVNFKCIIVSVWGFRFRC
jgi:hypothetical protein